MLQAGEFPLNPHDRRDKLFTNYDRGIITDNEANHAFLDLMLDAPDDDGALSLCDSLPDWFRTSFRNWLSKLADRDFVYRRFYIGDMRTQAQRELDAIRDQAFLRRISAKLFDYQFNIDA